MPVKSKRPCTHQGCKNLQPCPIHPRKAWVKDNEPERVRGRKLQEMRQRLLRMNPLCNLCMEEGRVSRALYRDHIIPLSEGGQDTVENTQGLCKACHDKKTKEEAKRGKKRG